MCFIRLQSSISRVACPRALPPRAPPLGSRPSSRLQLEESTTRWASRALLRSALSVSHALDGLLLPEPCALVSSRSRVQGSRSRGFFPHSGRITSSVTVTLAPLAPPPAGCPAPANVASTSGSCSEPWSAVSSRVFSSVRHPIPSCVFNSLGHSPGDLGSTVALPPLTTFTTRDCVSPASLAPSVSIDLRAVASVPRGPSRSSFAAVESVSLLARPIRREEALAVGVPCDRRAQARGSRRGTIARDVVGRDTVVDKLRVACVASSARHDDSMTCIVRIVGSDRVCGSVQRYAGACRAGGS